MVDMKINRPVFLAQRDKYFSIVLEKINENISDMSIDDRYNHINMIINIFSNVKDNMTAAMSSNAHDKNETLFLKFAEFIIDSLKTILVMNRYENLIHNENSFLKNLIGNNLTSDSKTELSAKELETIIFEKTRNMVNKSYEKFEKIKKNNYDKLNEEDRQRYNIKYNFD